MSIRGELVEATSIKSKKKESDPEFIKRLIEAVEDLDDDGWRDLSTEAQEFSNSVIEAKKKAGGEYSDLADEDVPTFPDEKEDGDVEEAGDDAEVDTETSEGDEDASGEDDDNEGDKDVSEKETSKKKKATPPAKKAAAKSSGKLAAKASAKPAGKSAKSTNGTGKKGVSAIHRIRQIVVKKPQITTEDLIAQLEKEGFKPSKMTVGTTKQGTRDTMKALVAAGLLEVEL